MGMLYVDVDNRLVKDTKKNTDKNKESEDSKKTIAESYGLSKNARILTE